MKNSYIIINRETNEAVLELFNVELLYRLKPEYTYKTALQYLHELSLISQINKM